MSIEDEEGTKAWSARALELAEQIDDIESRVYALINNYTIDFLRGEQDVRRYMRNLEEVVIRALGRHGIAACRAGGLTGVWTEEGKIAALGVHISRWITRHGFALNVNTDLACFDLIVPCGIAGCRVAAMQQFAGRPLDLAAVAEVVVGEFGAVLGRETVWCSAEELLDESDFTAAAERATIIEAARPGADRAAEFARRPTA